MSARISVSDKRLPSGPLAASDDAVVVSPLGAIVLAERAKESGPRLGCAVSEAALPAIEPPACIVDCVGSTAGFSGVSARGLTGDSVACIEIPSVGVTAPAGVSVAKRVGLIFDVSE